MTPEIRTGRKENINLEGHIFRVSCPQYNFWLRIVLFGITRTNTENSLFLEVSSG